MFDSAQELYKAIYYLNNREENSTDGYRYIQDFNKLKEYMLQKYKTPTEDKIVTQNTAAHQVDVATALMRGFTMYGTRWETDSTKIMLGMMLYEGVIITMIEYVSKEGPKLDTSGF